MHSISIDGSVQKCKVGVCVVGGVCDGSRCRNWTANLLPANCSVKSMENICDGGKLRIRCPSHSNFFLLVRGFHIYFEMFFYTARDTGCIYKKHTGLSF